jgi:two-component system alkaline phosphatase synthesis response regulator PhoP
MAHASEKTILVVDDEPDVRSFLATCIEDAGFKVETAVDGVDALDKIKANPPDLMTLDMVMPRHSGINLMRKLRQNEEWATIPVIVITAHARDEFGSEDIKKFDAFAAHHRPKHFMEKPVTPAKLVKAIAEILGVQAASDMADEGVSSEKEKVKKLIGDSDPETLKKVLDILNKQ